MVSKFSIGVVKPNWPKWLIWLVDQILFALPVLNFRKANRILQTYGNYSSVRFVKKYMELRKLTVTIHGRKHIPWKGAAIVVLNHPGGGDVSTVLKAFIVDLHRPDTVVLTNRFLALKPVINHIISVDTLASAGKKVPWHEIEEALHAGKIIVIYPAGKNSRYTSKGLLRDLEWKYSFVKMAKTYNVPVIVGHIAGTENTPFFHKVARFKERTSWLKKVPLENFFQVREFVKASGHVHLTFATPISSEFLRDHAKDTAGEKRLAHLLREFSYKIENHPEADFKKEYFT